MAKAGIKWKGDSFARYSDTLQRAKTDVVHSARKEADELGLMAAQKVIDKLMASGTKTNPQGRFDTWDMIRSVRYKVEDTPTGAVLKFGWPERGVPYVRFQDLGTLELAGNRNVDSMNPNGIGIPGVFALLDTFIQMREELQDRGYRGTYRTSE